MRKQPRGEIVPVEQFGELLGSIDVRDHRRRLGEALGARPSELKQILLNLWIEGRRLADFSIEFLGRQGN